MIKFVGYTNSDGKLNSIIKTSCIIRNEVFGTEQHFTGSFKDHKAMNTSHSLLMLLKLIIGFSVSDTNDRNSDISSSIAQLIQ